MTASIEDNLTNLHQLWQIQPFTTTPLEEGRKLYALQQWPHRVWVSSAEADTPWQPLAEVAQTQHIISVPLCSAHFQASPPVSALVFSFTQTMMAKTVAPTEWCASSSITLTPITLEDASQWAKICGECFQYNIEVSSILRLFHSSARLFFLHCNNAKVGTAMIFRQGNLAGIHQVGILPEFRGCGYAREAMQTLETMLMQEGVTRLHLQESEMGKPLYQQLGYKALGKITNFRLR